MALITGCASRQTATTRPSNYIPEIECGITPPDGWRAIPVSRSKIHIRYVWESPSKSTAVGVIRFFMPLPLGHDLALWGFTEEMRKKEGRAEISDKHWDESIQALRFTAAGNPHRVIANLYVDGASGWVVFAGTRLDREVNQGELQQAVASRNAAILQR